MISKCENCYKDKKTPSVEDCKICETQIGAEKIILYTFAACVFELVTAKLYKEIMDEFNKRVNEVLQKISEEK